MAEGIMNLLEFNRRFTSDNMALHSINLLAQHVPLLMDIPVQRSTENNNDVVSIQTGLPSVIRRKINQGVPVSYGERALASFGLGRFATTFEYDTALEDTGGSNNTLFMQNYEDAMQVMSISISHDMLYGNEKLQPASFTGLLPIYSSLDTNDPIHRNVIDARVNINGEKVKDSTVNNVAAVDSDLNRTSLFIGCFGPGKTYQTVPRNAVNSGHRITVEKGRINDNWGGRNEKLTTDKCFIEQTLGLTVADYRYNARICNINSLYCQSDIGPGGRRVGSTSTDVVGVFLPDLLYLAISRIPTFSPLANNIVIYGNLDMIMRLNQQLSYSTHQSTLPMEAVGGQIDGFTKGMFQGIPLRQNDQFQSTEARVGSVLA